MILNPEGNQGTTVLLAICHDMFNITAWLIFCNLYSTVAANTHL